MSELMKAGKINSKSKYDSVIHVIAEKLIEHFDFVGAVNYIEQVFEDSVSGRSFVLTMQMIDGETPCKQLELARMEIEILKEKLRLLKLNESEVTK